MVDWFVKKKTFGKRSKKVSKSMPVSNLSMTGWLATFVIVILQKRCCCIEAGVGVEKEEGNSSSHHKNKTRIPIANTNVELSQPNSIKVYIFFKRKTKNPRQKNIQRS